MAFQRAATATGLDRAGRDQPDGGESGSDPPGFGGRAPEEGQANRTLFALVSAVFAYALMQTVVVPALGLLQRELGASATWTAWILSAFLLSSAVLTPLLSRLGDRHGRRRVLLIVLAVYAAGMVAAALAQDIGQLIAARIVQGSALALVPLAFAIVRESLPSRRIASAMGLISGVVGAGAGAGLVVGGLLADHSSWRMLFVLGAALAILSVLLVAAWVPKAPGSSPGRLDLPGAVLLGAGLVALLLALTQAPDWGWASFRVLGLFVLAALLFVLLVGLERRRADALLDIDEFTDLPMLFTHGAALLFGAGSYFFYVTMPLYAQQQPDRAGGVGFGASVTVAGLLMLPGMLAIIPMGTVVGRMATAVGSRWPLGLGFTLVAVGSVSLAFAHAQLWQHVVFYTVVGAGSGLVMGSLPKLIADVVPPERTGTANGINNIVRTTGSVVGSQVAAAVIAAGTAGSVVSDRAFGVLFWSAAVVCLAGVAISPFAVRTVRNNQAGKA